MSADATEAPTVYVTFQGEHGMEIVPCKGTLTYGRKVYATWKEAHAAIFAAAEHERDEAYAHYFSLSKESGRIKAMQDPTL